MKVGIVVALQTEAETLLPRVGQRCGTTVAIGASLLLRCCGMGPERATDAARTLLAEGATALLSYGTAGALSPQLVPGALLLPERIAYRGTVYAVDASWRQRIAAQLSPLSSSHSAPHCAPVAGLLLSLAQPLTTVADKAEAFRTTGAVAVDMESGAVLAVAAQAGVPAMALRSVIDDAATALPPAAVAGVDLYGRPRLGAMLAALLRRPGDVVGCMRLGGDLRRARRSLEQVWAQLGPEGLTAGLKSGIKSGLKTKQTAGAAA